METTKIGITAGILALVVAGMFVFTHLKKNELEQTTPTPVPQTEEEEGAYGGITRIDAKHFYIDGTHTIAGELLMPTPCDLLNWDVRIQESMPETAVIDFDVINDADACAQVMTAQRFKVSFDASENAVIRANLEGRALQVNLIPALPGERPEDFELFIKG